MNAASLTLSNRMYVFVVGALVILVATFSLFALFVHASTGPVVNTVTTNVNNAVVTSAVIGSNVFEGAMVASSTNSAVPTGTVTFSSYANASCTGTPTVQSGVGLVNGMASSSATTVTNTGLSYIVNYNGDGNNLPSVGSCTVVSPVTASVSISNALSANTVTSGTAVTAHATLSNNTSVATGTVSYTVYTNNACTVATTSPTSVTVMNGVVPTSNAITLVQPGTYYWQEVYSGDNANLAATSTCGNSVLTVQAVTVTPPVTGTGTISGTVFNDTNNNRTLDSGEAGIAGVQIKLSVLQTNWWMNLMHMQKYVAYATTTSDANGNYSFSNLPTNVYKVEEIKTKGTNQTSRDFQPVPVSGTQGASGLNFANHTNGSSIGGNNGKGNDKDGDNDGDDHKFASTTVSINIHGKGSSKGLLQKVFDR